MMHFGTCRKKAGLKRHICLQRTFTPINLQNQTFSRHKGCCCFFYPQTLSPPGCSSICTVGAAAKSNRPVCHPTYPPHSTSSPSPPRPRPALLDPIWASSSRPPASPRYKILIPYHIHISCSFGAAGNRSGLTSPSRRRS